MCTRTWIRPRRGAASFVLAVGAWACVPGIASGAALTLERVLRSVERFHPVLVAAQTAGPEAEAKVLAAQGAFDTKLKVKGSGIPVGNYPAFYFDSVVEQQTPYGGVSLFGGYRLGLGSFALYDGKRLTQSGGELRAGVRVPLWRDRAIDRGRSELWQAKLGRRTAELGIKLRTLKVMLDAARYYWAWVAAGQRLEVARRLLRIAEARRRAIDRGVHLGQLPAIERAENQRLIVRRRAGVVSARRKLEKAAIALSLYWRDRQGTARVPSAGQLPGLSGAPTPVALGPEQAEIREAVARRPEVSGLRAQLAQVRVMLRQARNQTGPRVDLRFAVSSDMGPGIPKLGTPDFEVGLLVDIPLQARKARGKVAQAQAKVRRLEAKMTYARDTIAAQVRDARSALVAARERVALRAREVSLAQRLEAGERRRFRLGASNLFTVNLREQGTAGAEYARIDAQAEYEIRRAVYQVARGCQPLRC